MDLIVSISGNSSTLTLTGDGTNVTINHSGSDVTLAPLVSKPVLNPDSSRIVTLQTGPPGQAGPQGPPGINGTNGTGLEWVSITQAAYDALDPPAPDTIYDITDAPWEP